MRKGRFSALEGAGGDDPAALPLGRLAAFDFSVPPTDHEIRAAEDRAAFLLDALPIAACFRFLWSLLLLAMLYRQSGGVGGWAIPSALGLILAADVALPRFAGAARTRPAAVARVAGHAVLTGLLWVGVAILADTYFGGDAPLDVRALIVAGAGAAIPIVFAVPAVLLVACVSTIASAALLGTDPVPLSIGAGLTILFSALSLFRLREQIAAAAVRVALEVEARKARRFVEDFEGSGRGWFWETSAEGALTYVPLELARQLAQPVEAVIGRRLADLLRLDGAGADGKTLDFHLTARFPFENVPVRASADSDVCWSLSGKPNFDAYGRFLGFRGMAANLSARERREAEASRLARFDSLTGLPNRATMARMLDDALANAGERRRACALMMIDLDRFKQVNDTLGHPVGDQLLKQVAARLREALGEEGQVGRLGGDEFQAILPGVQGEGALSQHARRIIEEVSKPYEIDGHRVSVGASVGIAIAHPGKSFASSLVKEADLALYAAKADGRGTFRFFSPDMHAEATDRQILERDLAEALAKGQLHLVYQPVVETLTEEPVAFEALLRWQHPTRGLLAPDLVIPLATDAGLMPRIGAWVLRAACAEAAAWPSHLRVSVNLSPAEFADPGLPAQVAAALAASGLDAGRLELEISEEVFFADHKGSEAVLARLHGLGVRLALDNFGTGRSGLGHLRSAPLDKIKIDRSFVRGAGEAGSRNAAIVRAIVVLAESLRIDTTAEGAETLEDLALIRRLGCSQVQGFLFGAALTAAEARARAAASRPPAEVAAFGRPPRHGLIRTGKLEVAGEALPVRLRNISTAGAMVECDRAFAAETAVRLDLDEAGTLDAEVRWSSDGRVGMRFAAPFSLSRLARRAASRPAAKVLRPTYLDAAAPEPAPVPAEQSPLVTRKAKRR